MNKTETTQQIEKAFIEFEKISNSTDPDWIKSIRKESLDIANTLGVPIARRGNEEWKYTDIRSLSKNFFTEFSPYNLNQTHNEINKENLLVDSLHEKIIFKDGICITQMFQKDSYVSNIVTVNEIPSENNAIVKTYLGKITDIQENFFAALNTTFFSFGTFIYIPENTIVSKPIHISIETTNKSENNTMNPRILIVLGSNSKATIIEEYFGIGDKEYLSNSVIEITIGENANLEHYRIQNESLESYGITNTTVWINSSGHYESTVVDIGGKLVRNNLNVITKQEKASAKLNGIYIVNGKQHIDNQVIIDHAMPNTNSRELYKGILSDHSKSVFHGSIIVREGAHKVDAHQVDKNLLLSDDAEADTKPAFWIYCDDVKCGHGAACGKIDESAMFYLQSRGIPEIQARSILIYSFANEIITEISNQFVREYVEEFVQNKLESLIGIT
jgi:Fe-S cluster assembly protein SufD